jgi:hypothetical protein
VPLARRELVIHALWSIGGGLLALALLDLLMADFHDLELLLTEQRQLPGIPSDYSPGTWNLRRWQWIAEEAVGWGHALLTCFWIGLAATVHAVLRCARSQDAGRFEVATAGLAVTAVATIAGLWIAAGAVVRADIFAGNFIAVEPGLWIRWIFNIQFVQALRYSEMSAELLAGVLATLLLPCAAFAAGMVAVRRGLQASRVWSRTAALAVPAAVAVTAAAWLRIHYAIDDSHDDPYETWATALRSAESLVLVGVGVALSLGVALLRGPATDRPRWTYAAAALALGVAAALATAPHRSAYRALYPVPNRGVGDRGIEWIASPATLDPPKTGVCDWPPEDPRAVVTVDPSRGPLLAVEGMHWWLDAPNPDYPFGRWIRQHYDREYHHAFALLADRRVPAAQLVPFIAAAREAGVPRITVEAAALATLPTTDGRAITWNICTLGELDVDALVARELPPGVTWGDVATDRELVGPARPREEDDRRYR